MRAFVPPWLFVFCSADLSGQVLGNGLALEWGRRILEEFRLQGELEASLGLPPTMVASDDMETTMKGQHFFAAKVGFGVLVLGLGLVPETVGVFGWESGWRNLHLRGIDLGSGLTGAVWFLCW